MCCISPIGHIWPLLSITRLSDTQLCVTHKAPPGDWQTAWQAFAEGGCLQRSLLTEPGQHLGRMPTELFQQVRCRTHCVPVEQEQATHIACGSVTTLYRSFSKGSLPGSSWHDGVPGTVPHHECRIKTNVELARSASWQPRQLCSPCMQHGIRLSQTNRATTEPAGTGFLHVFISTTALLVAQVAGLQQCWLYKEKGMMVLALRCTLLPATVQG